MNINSRPFWLAAFVLISSTYVANALAATGLTESEHAFLKEMGEIRFCTARDSMPLDDIDNGEHVGINAEYLQLFEEFIDIPIRLVDTPSWNDSLIAIQAKQCDILALAARTPQRESYLLFTDSYVKIPFVIVTTQEKFFVSKLPDLIDKNLTLGVQKGFAYVELLRNKYPEVELIEVESTEDALTRVNNGEIFGFLTGLNMAGYSIQTGGYTNLKINGQFDELSTIELGIGIRKELPMLLPILNKAINSISAKEKKQIDGSWLRVRYDIVEGYQRAIQIAVVATIILLFLGYRQLNLRKHNRQLEEREKAIWHQANYDFLTGLPNRRLFQDRLSERISHATRQHKSFALLLIDLDRFKEINDTLGHDQGDKMLVEAARRIENCLRKSDSIARLGGDEFVVILDDTTQPENIEIVAEKILVKLAEPFNLKESAFVSASIGVTLCPRDSTDMVELLKNADQAMYAAKDKGRKNFHYFTPEMQHTAMQRMQMIKALRVAIQEEQFELHYQPIINLQTNACTKAEALIRWRKPDEGIISPLTFIPILEETGLINQVGRWVFTTAAIQAQVIRKNIEPNFQISVNTSPVQYQSKSTLNWVSLLEKMNIPTTAVAIEITESTLMEQIGAVAEHLLELRDKGVQVSLDDFGTGYSSLAYLKKFDIDYLKIDKSFIDNLSQNSSDLVLCEAMIVMAHKLGLNIIAEGVETAEQAELLRQAGCDFVQGYYYSRPLKTSDFNQFLTEFNKSTVLAP